MKFKNPLADIGRQGFAESLTTPRIVTTPKAIVTYAFVQKTNSPGAMLDQVFNPKQTDDKLIAILTANSQADLTKFEAALSIKILDIQREAKSETPSKPPTDDIEIGEIE